MDKLKYPEWFQYIGPGSCHMYVYICYATGCMSFKLINVAYAESSTPPCFTLYNFLYDTNKIPFFITDQSCSGTPMIMKGTTGTFTSPNYPNPPEISACNKRRNSFSRNRFITFEWEIHVPDGMAIQLQFGEFDMNGKLDECEEGEVEIFQGTSKTRRNLGKSLMLLLLLKFSKS